MTQKKARSAAKGIETAIRKAVDEFVSGLVGLLAVALRSRAGAVVGGARPAAPIPHGAPGDDLEHLAKTSGQRRTKEQMATLEEAVLRVIKANPQIDAKGVAARLGLTALDLRAPTQALRRRGAIHSEGRKQGTKYTAR